MSLGYDKARPTAASCSCSPARRSPRPAVAAGPVARSVLPNRPPSTEWASHGNWVLVTTLTLDSTGGPEVAVAPLSTAPTCGGTACAPPVGQAARPRARELEPSGGGEETALLG